MAWHSKALVDLCESIFAGGDVPKGRLSKVKNEQYSVPIYANGEKDKGLYGFTDVPRVTAPSMTVSARGTIGYSEIRYEPFLPVVRLIVLTPKTDEISLEFLKYALKGMDFKNSGTSIPQLTVPMIKNYKINLPDLAEQKRIVAILDQVFADIEKARATAETNLKNARELFDSYLQQVFSQRGRGWETHKLKNITSKIGSGATPRGGKEAYKDVGMSLIRSMNVHDRVFKEKNLALIDDEQASKLNNVELLENDILLNITGASVARCCVIPKEVLPGRVNQHVSIIRVDKSVIEPSLLCFLLTSKFYKDKLLGIGESGSTRQAITKVQIENFEIVFPQDLDEQKKLLKDLEALELKMLKLQDIYIKKSQSLVELKSSILQKAFTGELTKSKGIAA